MKEREEKGVKKVLSFANTTLLLVIYNPRVDLPRVSVRTGILGNFPKSIYI